MTEPKRSYSIFDHTADIGIEMTAPSLPALYETAAFALFDLMAEPVAGDPAAPDLQHEVRVTAADPEELLVRWLAELLYLYDAKGVVLSRFEVVELSPESLRARVEGSYLTSRRHRIKTEIKAVTYHQVSVVRSGASWKGRVILDV